MSTDATGDYGVAQALSGALRTGGSMSDENVPHTEKLARRILGLGWSRMVEPLPHLVSEAIRLIEEDRAEATASLRQALSSVHLALGESPDSDDASLGEAVAIRLRERDERIHALEARAAELERERDDAETALRVSNQHRDAALAQVEAERSRVGALEAGLREDVKILDYLSFLAGFLEDRIENEEAQARVQCVIHDLRAHALRAKDVRALLSPAPSPGTDHEDRKP